MVIISACLLGIECRYDGESRSDEAVLSLISREICIPVCPEQLGGLSTPRSPSEIVGGNGFDVLNGTAAVIDGADKRFLSVFSYMELLQGAKNKSHHRTIRDFLRDYGFFVLPLTENIGHRASIYIEEYALSFHLRAGDALVAATAVENDMPLITSNDKHFKGIKDLSLRAFKP